MLSVQPTPIGNDDDPFETITFSLAVRSADGTCAIVAHEEVPVADARDFAKLIERVCDLVP